MKKFLKTTWAVLLYLWQLPQNLIGLVYMTLCRDRVKITEQRGGGVLRDEACPGWHDTWPLRLYRAGEHRPGTGLRP